MLTRFLYPGAKHDQVSKVVSMLGIGKGDCQKLCKASGSINGEISLRTLKHLDSNNASLCNSKLENSLKIAFRVLH